MRSRFTVLLISLGLLAAACGGGSSGSDREPVQEGVDSRVFMGDFVLTVTGAVETEWSGQTPINVLTHRSEDLDRELWQLTVGILPQHALETDDGLRLRTAFDLIGFDGDGSYTIEPERRGGLTDEELRRVREEPELLDRIRQSTVTRSNSFMLVGPEDASLTQYGTLLEACTLDVREEGLEGSIECPRLASNDGGEIGYEWSWEADPNEEVDPREDREDTEPGEEDTSDSPTTTSSTRAIPTTNPRQEDGPSEDDPYGLYGDFPLEVTITPDDCATRGTVATVTVDAIADAAVTLLMAYSDGDPHGNAITGQTGPSGRFNWAFVVPPTAPDGQADLLVNVTSNDGQEGGGGIVRAFRVRNQC